MIPAAQAQSRLAAFVPPAPAVLVSSVAQPSGPGYNAALVHLDVAVGPRDTTTCNIVGELLVPTDASAAHPVPVILTTNGFGGSYLDQVAMAEYFAPLGYATLTYSGLGFGGSGCQIELDDPEWDGEAASQLISYLGDLPEILRDGPDDPRVGMVGGSEGGDIQFSTAAIDPRLDALVPMITWDDLAYSLAPDNADANFNDTEPGVLKYEWAAFFFADGLSKANPATANPTCPNFDPRICTALETSVALGYLDRASIDLLRHTSMVTYFHNVHVPVMLMQGEDDSLFNINEAVHNYRDLQSVGDPVKLVLQSWGHSHSTPAPGEVSYNKASLGYETLLITDWFAKYLKHEHVSTGPAVEYFRNWVTYDGSAEPAYGTASSWPVGTTATYYLSGGGTLVTAPTAIQSRAVTFVNVPAAPTSYSETSELEGTAPVSEIPPTDAPGTFTSFESAPLVGDVDTVGVPEVSFALSSTSPAGLDPETDPVVVAKLYDVAPNGGVTLVDRLVAPARIDDETQPVTMTLPGVVHRYAAGDRIELVLAASDAAYLGSRIPDVLTVTINPSQPSALQLQIVSGAGETSGGGRATGA